MQSFFVFGTSISADLSKILSSKMFKNNWKSYGFTMFDLLKVWFSIQISHSDWGLGVAEIKRAYPDLKIYEGLQKPGEAEGPGK